MLNQCQFIGNLGADPEVRAMNSGDKVANIRVAVTERWKDKNTGEKKEKTEWVSVVIWGALAGIAEQYLRKGSKVFVQGKLQTRKWQDQSGADRYSTEVVLQGFDAKLQMLDAPQGGNSGGGGGERQGGGQSSGRDWGRLPSGGGSSGGGASGGGFGSDLDDDIPF